MDPIDRRLMLGAAGLVGVAAFTKLASAGPLDPPAGPISPTGHTTDELYARIARSDAGMAEPRIPVQSLAGSKTALHVISEPGSYYLADNIVGEPGQHGIEIASSNVTLDLAGFTLRGVPGALRGVTVAPSDYHNVAIARGVVTSWEQGGVNADNARLVHLADLQIWGNAGCTGAGGVGPSSLVERVMISQVCAGLFIEEGSLLRDCSMYNCESGFFMRRSIARGCRAMNMNGVAFYLETSGAVCDCDLRQCNGAGVQLHVGENAIVQGNTFNRCNIGVLVQATRGVLISNNQFSQNGVGIQLEPASRGVRVEANNVDGDGDGLRATGEAAVILRNSVRSGAIAYSIAPGNSHGPIVNVVGVGDISSAPNANHPWANFVY